MYYNNEFYTRLNKPRFNPPNWLFKWTWSLLYFLMLISMVTIVQSNNPLKLTAISLFIIQFILNLSWTPLFFEHHKIKSAFWLIVVLFFLVLAMIIVFSKISLLAGLLQIPYLFWLFYAAIINWFIVKLNPYIEEFKRIPKDRL